MKKILEAFKGAEGEVSSKRLVGIVGAFICSLRFAPIHLVTSKLRPATN
jgi:hypothetical protein